MEKRPTSFIQKISRLEVIGLIGLVIIGPILRGIRRVLDANPCAPAYIGLFLPVVLNCIGTSIGIAVISRAISGASIRTPGIVYKGLIGMVICEANLIFSLMSFFFLKDRAVAIFEQGSEIELKHVHSAWALFGSGMISGMCGLIGSFGGAIVNTASTVALTGSSKCFSKLISLQMIVGGVGALGLILSLSLLKLCAD
ncbi:V-type H+-transporting ATPase 21kDa proteolipid subunit [Nematocida homosporus]|uniref:V-type H+-transporting ATPase 21kDa proteolipid subunit n=1 Tax=Nematocida homosporus TaxID=1912981 RepID=UPI00221F41D8|nr:V-type H+-transporting ATPase 21kDa proteolipid subunit [Nematocida homosporus]KAI5186633.1 V-type H+-transporting ATPase 21kDa proteolipid subunit [Nematocida homosporus]